MNKDIKIFKEKFYHIIFDNFIDRKLEKEDICILYDFCKNNIIQTQKVIQKEQKQCKRKK